MRARATIACVLLVLTSISAGAQVEMTVPEAGRVKTTAKVENGILGVSNSYTRIRGVGTRMCGSLLLCQRNKNQGLDMP